MSADAPGPGWDLAAAIGRGCRRAWRPATAEAWHCFISTPISEFPLGYRSLCAAWVLNWRGSVALLCPPQALRCPECAKAEAIHFRGGSPPYASAAWEDGLGMLGQARPATAADDEKRARFLERIRPAPYVPTGEEEYDP